MRTASRQQAGLWLSAAAAGDDKNAAACVREPWQPFFASRPITLNVQGICRGDPWHIWGCIRRYCRSGQKLPCHDRKAPARRSIPPQRPPIEEGKCMCVCDCCYVSFLVP